MEFAEYTMKRKKTHQKQNSRRKHARTLQTGLIMLGILILLAVFAPVICRYDPLEQNLADFLQPPGKAHWFGTDHLGRDLFARVLYAARTDLTIMFLAEIAPFAIGVFLGMLAGYYGGFADWLIGLAADTFIAFPFYLLVIVIAFATGAGTHGIFITYLLVGWLIYCKVARGQTASLKTSEWIFAARIMGYSDLRILLTQLLPNILPQAVVLLMTDMVGLLVIIVTLGYLGIGIAPPAPDWGTMISEGQSLMTTAWWLSVIPGIFVVYTGIALSFIGDGLADRWR